MSLHSIIEPAGTLLTGWKLVPRTGKEAADIRNDDECTACPADEGDRTPQPPEETRSRWEVGEVR